MGVYAPEATPPDMPIGVAYWVGAIDDDRGAVALARLVVDKVELPGVYACDRRRFVRVEEQGG